MAIRRTQGPNSGRVIIRLIECPACGEDLSGATGQFRSAHIAGHNPEDFGLPPLRD